MRKKIKKFPLYILDKFSVADIKNWEKIKNQVLEYYWNVHSVLAHQRAQIFDELKQVFILNSTPYEFSQWQRVITYAFSIDPLSAKGSTLSVPGGRFNIGDIDETKFPKFPALYIAEDRKTAYMEKFGINTDEKGAKLKPGEFTLTEKEPVTILSISGKLESVFDLNNKVALSEFIELTKNFKLPTKLNEMAKRIQAILYPSQKTGKKCLAIFPKNFVLFKNSFIQLEGDIPSAVTNKKMDFSNWESFI